MSLGSNIVDNSCISIVKTSSIMDDRLSQKNDYDANMDIKRRTQNFLASWILFPSSNELVFKFLIIQMNILVF